MAGIFTPTYIIPFGNNIAHNDSGLLPAYPYFGKSFPKLPP
jgi:hypothetical protein